MRTRQVLCALELLCADGGLLRPPTHALRAAAKHAHIMDTHPRSRDQHPPRVAGGGWEKTVSGQVAHLLWRLVVLDAGAVLQEAYLVFGEALFGAVGLEDLVQRGRGHSNRHVSSAGGRACLCVRRRAAGAPRSAAQAEILQRPRTFENLVLFFTLNSTSPPS